MAPPGTDAWFARLALAEVDVMSLTIGVAVALSQTPPPPGGEASSTAESLLGYPLPSPMTTSTFLTEWRVDTLWAPLAVLALIWYVRGVAIRHLSVAAGTTVTVSMRTGEVHGAPVTLALRTLQPRRDGSRGAREWLLLLLHSRLLNLLGHPIVAAAMFVGSLVVFYSSDLFEMSLRSHTLHVLMVLHFLLSGYLLAFAICGVDPGPTPSCPTPLARSP